MIKDEYYAITTNSSSSSNSDCDKLYVLDNTFQSAGTIELEYFYYSQSGSPGYQIVSPSAEFVFSSSDGNKIIVISEASNYYYSDEGWGIEIIDK